MERPTCDTCPYWAKDEESPNKYGHIMDAECRRHAPSGSSGFYEGYDQEANCEDGENPREWIAYNLGRFAQTSVDQWCGDHPDFPEYITSLKRLIPSADQADSDQSG